MFQKTRALFIYFAVLSGITAVGGFVSIIIGIVYLSGGSPIGWALIFLSGLLDIIISIIHASFFAKIAGEFSTAESSIASLNNKTRHLHVMDEGDVVVFVKPVIGSEGNVIAQKGQLGLVCSRSARTPTTPLFPSKKAREEKTLFVSLFDEIETRITVPRESIKKISNE